MDKLCVNLPGSINFLKVVRCRSHLWCQCFRSLSLDFVSLVRWSDQDSVCGFVRRSWTVFGWCRSSLFSTHPSRLYSLSTANFRFAEFGELLKSWRRTYNAEGLRGAALEWVTGSYWRRAINLNVAGSAFFRAFSSFPHHSSQQVGLICASPVRKSPKPEATRGIFEIIDSEGVKCICIFWGAFPKRVQPIHR